MAFFFYSELIKEVKSAIRFLHFIEDLLSLLQIQKRIPFSKIFMLAFFFITFWYTLHLVGYKVGEGLPR